MTATTPVSDNNEYPSSPLRLNEDAGIDFEEMMKERNRVRLAFPFLVYVLLLVCKVDSNSITFSLFFFYQNFLKIRKEREEFSVAELKVQICRLEDALAAETKRRVDATTGLDDKTREEIYAMEERLRSQMIDDNKRLEERIAQVEARLEELEYRWEREATHQLDVVSQKSQEFEKSLKKLQFDQDTERKARLRREGSLLQQVENHATEFEQRWNSEQKAREDRISLLEQNIQQQLSKRQKEEESFHLRVQAELQLLKKDLKAESQERQAQDEEIVEALNRYTRHLQQSLSVLSSD